jgi:hypothetical protein
MRQVSYNCKFSYWNSIGNGKNEYYCLISEEKCQLCDKFQFKEIDGRITDREIIKLFPKPIME